VRGSIRNALALLLLLAAFAFVADDGSAVRDPCQVTIESTSSAPEARVSSSDGATAMASGEVTFQQPAGTTAVVNLSASTDTGWPVSIDPQTATLNKQSPVFFVVIIQVPAAAPAGASGNIIVDARVRINTFACTAPAPLTMPVTVGPYVDVFGARILDASQQPAASGPWQAFDIEVEVRSNAPMRVNFAYTGDGGWQADGPTFVDVQPTFQLVATEAIHVSVHGDQLRPGYTGIDVLVSGVVDGLAPYAGHLGFLIYVPPTLIGPVPTPLPDTMVVLALTAAAIGAGLVVHRRNVKQRAALAHLRQIVAEAKAAGRLRPAGPVEKRAQPSRAPSRPPRDGRGP
jgi:hypothetical protein